MQQLSSVKNNYHLKFFMLLVFFKHTVYLRIIERFKSWFSNKYFSLLFAASRQQPGTSDNFRE